MIFNCNLYQIFSYPKFLITSLNYSTYFIFLHHRDELVYSRKKKHSRLLKMVPSNIR